MSPPGRRPLATGWSWSSCPAPCVVVVADSVLPGTVVAGSVVEPQVPSNRPVDTTIAATDSMWSTPQRRTGPWTAADYRAGWVRDSGARNGQESAHLWLRSRRIDRSRRLHRLPWASGRRPRGRPSVSPPRREEPMSPCRRRSLRPAWRQPLDEVRQAEHRHERRGATECRVEAVDEHLATLLVHGERCVVPRRLVGEASASSHTTTSTSRRPSRSKIASTASNPAACRHGPRQRSARGAAPKIDGGHNHGEREVAPPSSRCRGSGTDVPAAISPCFVADGRVDPRCARILEALPGAIDFRTFRRETAVNCPPSGDDRARLSCYKRDRFLRQRASTSGRSRRGNARDQRSQQVVRRGSAPCTTSPSTSPPERSTPSSARTGLARAR